IPLVPADKRADAAEASIGGLKAEIAGREVILLVVERIVGDVHLAVKAGDGPIGTEGHSRVVVKACRATLKERCNDGDASPTGHGGQLFRGWTGDGFGEVEETEIFTLAEVLGAKEFGQADDVRTLCGGMANAVDGGGEVGLGVSAHAHLDEADFVIG